VSWPWPAPLTLPLPVSLGFLVPGLKEVVLVALVALALYGRSGTRLLRMTPYGRSIEPWLRLVRPPSQARARRQGGGPAPKTRRPRGAWFWALALTVGAAAVAWIATRVAVYTGSRWPSP
jgi:hypothetical protein